MNTYETMLKRRSCKKYKSDAVSDELIDKVVNAGLYAASGKNRQASIIIAVTDKEVRDELSALNAKILGSDIDPFYNAPAVLVVLADRDINTYLYDGSLTMGNMMLAAEELGLGSCWIHRAKEMFDTDEGKALLAKLGIEGDYEGIGNLVLGYSDQGEKVAPPRKENRVYKI
nr:nitroreductase [Clostridia bacterium]